MGNDLHIIFVNETKIVVTVDTMAWDLHSQSQIPMSCLKKNGCKKGVADLKGIENREKTYPLTY